MLHAISVNEIQLSLHLQLVPEDFQIIPTFHIAKKASTIPLIRNINPTKVCGPSHMSHMGSTSNVLDIL
ncbi:hypothetical protein NQ315_002010 [Exocentrus adspersus]|uniref:Uncharacterized protein n=1 Tax=Exocentrus adspersus TaxID=1586481 RepID=A0AAV8WB27_9CUCU|nr:hypothetical protein NQ315_002010 [Exocentrus adspersus]